MGVIKNRRFSSYFSGRWRSAAAAAAGCERSLVVPELQPEEAAEQKVALQLEDRPGRRGAAPRSRNKGKNYDI